MRSYLLLLFALLPLTLVAQLSVDFSASPLEICVGESIQFNDLTSVGGSPIQTWTWDFGDGNASNAQNPLHTFTDPGTYNITLTVQTQDGNSDVEVKSGYILVNPLPVVDFSLSGLACSIPFSANFTNNSSSGAEYNYSWNFGNGQTSSDQNPTGITYTSSGTYNVSLSITNSITGCTNSFDTDIDIYDYSAGMNISDSICLNQIAQFQDASTPGTDSWSWNFGDGSSPSTSQDDTHTYSNPGTYTVTLTTENTVLGCSSTITQDIVVLPVPNVGFTADDVLGCNPMDVTFTNTSTGASQYQWNFGDGNTYAGATPPPHTYSDTGWYSVSLTAISDNGCVSSLFMHEMIRVEEIHVDFTMSQIEGCAPLDVNFNDATIVPEPNQDPIVDWSWDFGNGNTYNGQFPPMQTYGVGSYSPSLTITTASGCVDDTMFVDTVLVGMIDSIGFTYTPADQCGNAGVSFTSQTVISIPYDPAELTFSWDFGDGGASTNMHPTHPYAADTGYFDVQLIVNLMGCEDTVTVPQAVHINAPLSRFAPSATVVCNPTSFPVQIDFMDNSIIGQIPDDAEMIWKWGDSTFTYFDDPDFDDSDQGSTSHNYNDYGTFDVEQVIHNYETGCSDSSKVTISISFIDAGFSLSDDTICLGQTISIYDTTLSNVYVLIDTLTNNYNMGDGEINYGPSHTHTYSSWGTYPITHQAINSVGCVDTTTVDIVVLDLPSAGILADDNAGCAPLVVNFENTSTPNNNGLPIVSNNWTLADSSWVYTPDVNQDIQYTFDQEGTFLTALQVTDAFGCQATALTATSITKPTADFNVDSVLCNLENFVTDNQSTGQQPFKYTWLVDGVIQDTTNLNYTGSFDETNTPGISANHTIDLVVTDVNGCSDTLSQPVIVSLPDALANYSFSAASINAQGQFTCPPVFASLQDSSQSIGQLTAWNWTFGNGNASTLQNPQNTYVFSGVYTATLSVEDEFGCTDDTIFTDYVTILGPSATPGWTNIGDFCDPQIQFYAEDQQGVHIIEWDMGDGQMINDTSAFIHYYDTTGTYTPMALVSDNNGCQIPYQLPDVSVFYNDLDALFSASMNEGEVSEPFTFSDHSAYNPVPISSWQWDFSTNTITNNSDDDITFAWDIPGQHDVTLTIIDTNGCTDSYTQQVLVTTNFVIPNVFTPDGDGINDYFRLDFDVFNGYDYVILNRWGQVMVEGKDVEGPLMWDGYAKSGKPCSEGVYFYKVVGHYHDGTSTTKHGHVTLAR